MDRHRLSYGWRIVLDVPGVERDDVIRDDNGGRVTLEPVRALALVLVPLVAAGCGAPSDDTRRPASDPAKVESSAGPSEPAEPGVALEIDDPRIDESSGLARSREHPGVLYTHNDAGNGPDLYAVDHDGTRAVITVEDAEALDWEDMASTRDGRLWIGDIGDREGVRSTISVSVVPEPTPLTTTTVAATTYRFTYPDGPHDAEALLIDPRRFRIYVVTKAPDGAGIYVARKQPLTDRANMLTRVGDAPPTSPAATSPRPEVPSCCATTTRHTSTRTSMPRRSWSSCLSRNRGSPSRSTPTTTCSSAVRAAAASSSGWQSPQAPSRGHESDHAPREGGPHGRRVSADVPAGVGADRCPHRP